MFFSSDICFITIANRSRKGRDILLVLRYGQRRWRDSTQKENNVPNITQCKNRFSRLILI